MEELTQEMVQLALELIDEFGGDIVYTAIEAEKYNPATSSNSLIPQTPVEAKAVVEDYSLQNSGEGFRSGLIKSGDKKFIIAGAALSDVEVGGKLLFNSKRYTAMNVKEYYVGNTPVLFEVQGRS